MPRICVFCGSRPGLRPDYIHAAVVTGRVLAERGIGLVYGGGRTGLMGALADSALAAGADVIGIMPRAMVEREVAHTGLPDLRIVESMHERKALMAGLSDAFMALPGGYGTLEEFCEALTWSQLGLHRKPCGLLNVAGFYDPLLALFEHSLQEGFVRREHRAMVQESADVDELVTRLLAVPVPVVDKWIDPPDT